MKIAVIVNPTAGFKHTPWHEPVRKKVSELGEVEFFTPESPQGTTAAARDAAARGFGLIIAAGGDGTVHRVVSAEGKTLTVENKGKHSDGKAYDDTLVFDKQ